MAVTCQSCNGREFVSLDALQRHMNDSKKAHHFCWSCTQPFPTRAALVDHASTMHSELVCTAPTCQRIFADEDALRRHLFDSPKHPKCRACGVGFRDANAQRSHKREAHGATCRRKQSRPFSPTSESNVSPRSSPSTPEIPVTLSSQFSDSPKSTYTPVPSVDILDAPFMLSPTSYSRHGSPTNTNDGSDFPVSVDSTSTLVSDDAREAKLSKRVGSPSRSSRRRHESSRSRSRSPHAAIPADSPPSSMRTDLAYSFPSPDAVVEPLRISKNEETTYSERTINYPEEKFAKVLSPHVNPIISRLDIAEEQPRSPFDAHFLSQLSSDKGFSSPLLQTTAFFSDTASDSCASEDEVRRLTPVAKRQLRDLSGSSLQLTPAKSDSTAINVGSSRTRSSELKSILSRSASRKRNEGKTLLRRSTLVTSLSSPNSPSLLDNSRRPSTLLLQLARRSEQSMHQGSTPVQSPLPLPPRRPEARKRLSLSPRLAPIPESTLQEVSPRPLSGSDSDSDRESLGIFELNEHDLLFDEGMSEGEEAREEGISPPTSIAPTEVDSDELGDREEECQEQFEDDVADISDRSCSLFFPAPPPLIIEELNRMVREMCPSSPEDDPFADPFSVSSSPSTSNVKDLSLLPVSAEMPSHEIDVASNEVTPILLTPPRSTEIVAGKRRASSITPVYGSKGKGPSDEVRSPFTAPEDVNEEDIYLTPDELENSLAQSPKLENDRPPMGDQALFLQIPSPSAQRNTSFGPKSDSQSIEDGDTQFIEENHPLGNLITLDSPLIATPWRPSLSPLSPPPSPGHNVQATYTHDMQALFAQPSVSASSPRDVSRESPSVRMHCRLCMRDPCEDATATFCGHVFCYRCITREVVERAACPTCQTPTLLYCLFRLDLLS